MLSMLVCETDMKVSVPAQLDAKFFYSNHCVVWSAQLHLQYQLWVVVSDSLK